MKVVEMGRIRCIANDIAEEVKEEIAMREAIKDFEWSWFDHKCQSQIFDFIREKLNNRLPENGYIVEATKEEIRALPFNAYEKPVTLAPVDTSCGTEHRQLAKRRTELQKFRASYDESFANSASPKPDMEENGERKKRNCERFDNFDTAKAEFNKAHPEYLSPFCGVDEYYEALGKWLYAALDKFRKEYNGGATA